MFCMSENAGLVSMSYKKLKFHFIRFPRIHSSKTFASESCQTVTTAISKTTQTVNVSKIYTFHIRTLYKIE